MDTIEEMIVAKGKTAPRVTVADIDGAIAGEYFFTADKATEGCPQFDVLKRITFCVLVMQNGFAVIGNSVCVSPENFDAAIGQRIARDNAKDQVGMLLGYKLRDDLHNAPPTPVSPQEEFQLDDSDGGHC